MSHHRAKGSMKASDILDTYPGLGEFAGPRPPCGAEHHVVEREPHREVLCSGRIEWWMR